MALMSISREIKALQQEVEAIKARNKRVEADKGWETSIMRRLFVAAATYLVIVIFLVVINVEKPFETAIVPLLAYLLSTASVGIVKSWWLKNRKTNKV